MPATHSAEFCLVREETATLYRVTATADPVLVHGNRLVGAKGQQPVPFIAVWKSDLVGSDIDPLHGVFGERAANPGWGPWFLRNLALRRHHPICPGEHFPGPRTEAHRETRPTA